MIYHLIHTACKHEHMERGTCCFCDPAEDCKLTDPWIEKIIETGKKEREIKRYQENPNEEERP